ncbi:glycoside hydrolase family 127 protein [Paenibacillus mendelii]|uniref:Glycoside hydrolase family 127 protein n=1 Tax=Paenibacillus mendelii TaxID=206163 RepID=A0ABV6JGA7_9BACL|nr:beta-L-arabinofuranosidase domain-containing protein [Paenibacillus mendelii]MCQ6557343.1 glycoside hydrolase family 127 protein [Paenibacillus mendelii]
MGSVAKAFQRFTPVPFTQVAMNDAFWVPRLRAHKSVTLPVCLDKCEQTGRISNFAKAASLTEGEFEGIFFNDSDVYKVLEGAAYSLMTHPDTELEERVDAIIDLIAAAQEEDGYLMTYFTLAAPDKKWSDMEKHEMYCGGHLIEAAVAYKQATGKDKLLNVACKLADHYDAIFGPGKRHWVDGHEEIELALIKLYHETGEERYWKLAHWLLEERGHDHGVGTIWDKEEFGPKYCQDDKPVRDMTDVSGHAVRAMYLYTAMADVVTVTGDLGYKAALDRLWESVVQRNMYITGGIGPSKHNEGFTVDYDLPNEEAYCETCAAVGMVLWNHRMNLLHGDSKYADIVERVMYNGAIAGVSLSGDKFFYVNPLASQGHHHRVEWFDCSCCPSQIARFLPSIGNYVYAASERGVVVNMYMQGSGTIPIASGAVGLTQQTEYPWNGNVAITVNPERSGEFEILLRYPGWCKGAVLSVNGEPQENFEIEKGYIRLNRVWKAGDIVSLQLDMPVERVKAHPKVGENVGKVALQRGPVVYCLEETDQLAPLESISIDAHTMFLAERHQHVLEGAVILHGQDVNGQGGITAIPYYAWDNRQPGGMAVWLTERERSSDLYR